MKIPKNTDDFVDDLFHHVHGDRIAKKFEELIQNHGRDVLDLLKEQYGDDIKEKILAFLDADKDGSITDTVPDIFESALNSLTDLLSR